MTTGFKIIKYKFDKEGRDCVAHEERWTDWPVVYLINDSKSIYVGETSNAAERMAQHLANPEKKWLQRINIIFDETFNKSAILDIEQNLIQYFSADANTNWWQIKKNVLNTYKILNKNWGQSSKHNYYQRESYVSKIDEIREQLRKLWLARNNIEDIRNSDLFKYSPYNTLTEEQNQVSKSIIYDMINKLKEWKEWTAIINWWAWTWKTIVLINMIYKLINACKIDFDEAVDDPELYDYIEFIHNIKTFIKQYKWDGWELKIAYISPMTSLRATISEVFKNTWHWLKSSLVIYLH